MSVQKLTTGSAYTYLTDSVARNDLDTPSTTLLTDYYDERGEAPGVWIGSGLVGIDGLTEGDPVTAEQMEYLFGKGEHPLAEQRLAALGPEATLEERRDAVRLGRPFRRPDTSAQPFRTQFLRRYGNWNQQHGKPRSTRLPDDVRSKLLTDVAIDWFTSTEHRAPNQRELAGLIVRMTRPHATPVAGYDLTFSPVKSVSALWALVDRRVASIIEAAHHAAVRDALRYIERQVLMTRKGHAGVEQIEVTGLLAAAFTHRDNRAGDPDLHTHVAVANKVQSTIDGQWRAIDGRVLHKAITAASERYNAALESHLTTALGLRFADTARMDGRRPVRELVGVEPRLISLWSTRRTAISRRAAELAAEFQNHYGRPPTPAERQEQAQQATLETREAKHEPRSRNEQRALWYEQAVALLGRNGVASLLRIALGQAPLPAPTLDANLFRQLAAKVIATVEEHQAEWQIWHVEAEALRATRGLGIPPHQLGGVVDNVVQTTLATCVSLDPPDDGISEPDALRRADGTSVYRVVGSTRYTSHRILFAEQRIVDAAGRSGGRKADPNSVDAAILAETTNGTELNPGQTQLVRELALSGNRVRLALAAAGTGKTTAMRALATAWTYSGGNVVALAPSATAAAQLAAELGDRIPADTLHKLAHEIGRAEPAAWVRRVDQNTLILIDEAGMADTLRLDYVISWAIERGASIRLIGDDQQLGAVSAGGVLRDIVAAHGAVRLDEVMRFTDRAEAHATLALRDGDPAALGYYLDHDRLHVGDATTAAGQVFDAWLADKRAGLDAIMLAPTREQVATLNHQARDHRLREGRAGREAALCDGNQASTGDTIVTRRNDRRLRAGKAWVKNGDRWQVTGVHRDGALDVHDPRTRRRLTLPSAYVAGHVELGYATTIHGAQGLTADTCHGLLTGRESRQQLYTMLSRGRQANHAYVEIGGDGDPHSRFHPDTVSPPTATERLEAILARSDVPASATTQIAALSDPRTQLGTAVALYQDAIITASEEFAGPDLVRRLDAAAESTGIDLTESDAWPVLRSHLLVLHANGCDPFSALLDAAASDGVEDARDPAAVIDHRLDIIGLREAPERRPLPWLSGVPERLAGVPKWSRYLAGRRDLVVRLAGEVEAAAQTSDVPRWAAALVRPPSRDVITRIELWRAAHQIPETDLRPTGPDQHHLVGARAQHRLDGLIAGEAEQVLNWLGWIHEAAPATVDDPATIRVARECAEADPEGAWLRTHVVQEASRPLPDEHKADALRFRLEMWLHPVWETVSSAQLPRHDPRRDLPHLTPRPSRGIDI